MEFLGCLLGLFLGIFLLALNLGIRLWWNFRKLFGGSNGSFSNTYSSGRTFYTGGQQGQNSQTSGNAYGNQQQDQTSHSSDSSSSQHTPHGKVFADNEGEYVDFEEVKE